MSQIPFNQLIAERKRSIAPEESKADFKHDIKKKVGTELLLPKITSTEDLRRYGFEVGPVLGEGTYSKVRSASYKGQSIAVKIITISELSKEFSVKFLPREIELLSKVRHENIIKVYKIFNFTRRVYIFMELLEGGDLLNYVRNHKRLKESEARQFFRQMVHAIKYLHHLNIAHRDIKCENIMLDAEGNIRVIDFGFCRSTVDQNEQRILSQTYCGSTAYAAPEVLQGKPYNPMLYDVWSLGCVLYIMVTGRMAFDDSNVRKMLSYQTQKQIRFPTSFVLSYSVKELIKSMLEPDLTRRATMERVGNSAWLKEGNDIIESLSIPFAGPSSVLKVKTPFFNKKSKGSAVGARSVGTQVIETSSLEQLKKPGPIHPQATFHNATTMNHPPT